MGKKYLWLVWLQPVCSVLDRVFTPIILIYVFLSTLGGQNIIDSSKIQMGTPLLRQEDSPPRDWFIQLYN